MQLNKIILAVFGVSAVIVGWGMWKEPQINFESLVSLMSNELLRIVSDPFAIIGVMVMLLGLWALFKAIFDNEDVKGIFSLGRGQDEF